MKMKMVTSAVAVLISLALLLAGCSAAATTASAVTAPAATVAPSSAPSTAPSTVASAVASTAATAGQTFTGYVIDQACGVPGIDIQDGSDLTKLADKHTLSCAMMARCIASGYGLSIKQADGTYKFYKFDTAGSKLALDNIINKTTKVDNLLVDVTGTMSGDTITVATIVEK